MPLDFNWVPKEASPCIQHTIHRKNYTLQTTRSKATKRYASTTKTTAKRESQDNVKSHDARNAQIIPYMETKMRPRDNAGSHAEDIWPPTWRAYVARSAIGTSIISIIVQREPLTSYSAWFNDVLSELIDYVS